jgi:hypothetical protein
MKSFCFEVCFIAAVVFSGFQEGFSQEKNVTLTGYVKDVMLYYQPKTKYPGTDNDFFYSNVIHNRLNFRWYTNAHLTFGSEVRNRLLAGTMVRDLPYYKSTIDFDPGHFNLAKAVVSEKSWFLHTIVDRAWMDYTGGKWQVTLGRQRINWGMNLVWNPNDLFNTFSYFDYDYEERPGCDALRIKYFEDATSSLELAFKAGHTKEENTFAGLYRFLAWNYDFQFLAGQSGPDNVAGLGWSGDIKGGGFRGEVSWFIPRNGEVQSKESAIASVSGDYTLRNNLYVHGGFLFNSQNTTLSKGLPLFDLNLGVKNMSLSKYAIFLQASYPITPLFKVNASSIINAEDGSFYMGPIISWSLSNNLELSFISQLFFGDQKTEYGDTGKALSARMKWAF